jgi:spermidine synthase
LSYAIALLVSFVAGVISLSYEILWYRVYGIASGSSPTTFGLLLGFYLLGLAFGSYVSIRLCDGRDGTGNPRQIKALSAFLFLANAAGFFVIPLAGWLATVAWWRWALPPVALAAALLGSTLPLLSHFGVAPDDRAGAGLSGLYFANILGSVFGSLLTGFVLLEAWPLRRIAVVLALAGIALALALALVARRPGAGVGPACLAAAGAALCVVIASPPLFDDLYARLLYREKFREARPLAEIVENRHDVVVVTADKKVYGGGVYDGAISTSLWPDPNGIDRAYALAALHPSPSNVLVICLSAGAWAQVIARLPGVRSMTAVEINPGYLQIIARHPEVSGLLYDPRIRIVIDDGRRWLRRNPAARFDLIVENASMHWRAHATHILSVEHFRLVRDHMTEGGLFFVNTTGSPEVIRTLLEVFPYALRFRGFVAASARPIHFDGERWKSLLDQQRAQDPPLVDGVDPEGRKALADLYRIEAEMEGRESMAARTATARIVTDDNMAAEWSDASSR